MSRGVKPASLSVHRFPKWRAVYSRHRSQLAGRASGCGGASCAREWKTILAKFQGGSHGSIVERVNRYVNSAPHVDDPRNWGREDHWATPLELFHRGGDCEDYAIAKLLLLREFGIPQDRMRILTLRATATQAAHAVLVVDTSKGALVLDNLRSSPYALTREVLARVVYAFNGKTWWVSHGAAPVLSVGYDAAAGRNF